MIGTVLCNGKLDFVYHHMNQNMEIKTGKCHSVPTVQENGKIELSENGNGQVEIILKESLC